METTLMQWNAMPSCAVSCGHLYDANGACVPPAVPTGDTGSYASCFCADSRVSAFSAGTAGVCDTACTATSDLLSIRNWFTSYCSANAKAVATTTSSQSSSSTSSSSSSKASSTSGGGTWLSSHWQWVIFIVVVVVGIAGIWIGACIWRRRYLRRRDRQYALGKSLAARTSGGVAANGLTNTTSHATVHDVSEMGNMSRNQHGTPSEKTRR